MQQMLKHNNFMQAMIILPLYPSSNIIEIEMFLTQTQFEGYANREGMQSQYKVRCKSMLRKKFEKLESMNSDVHAIHSKKSSSTRTFNASDFNKLPRNSITEKKWNKIVDLYKIPNHDPQSQTEIKSISPGITMYRLLANPELLKKYKLKINFPQTFLQISGEVFQLKTNTSTKFMECSKIEREQFHPRMQSYIEREMRRLRPLQKQNEPQHRRNRSIDRRQQSKFKYKKHYDYTLNHYAPVIVTKIADDFDRVFEVDVESYKTFAERRSKPSNNKTVQRFIYSRNMKAMILRICYNRRNLGTQHEQFFAYRFQNTDNIFRANKKNNQIYQTFKAQSTINASYQREDKLEYSKLVNMKGLQKYIEPSKAFIKFLEESQKIKINQIYLDYVVDLFDEPWLINVKKIEYDSIKRCASMKTSGEGGSMYVAGSYGVCRLCSTEYLKKYLRKSISNKMLCSFLAHLKKRLKQQQFEKITFVKQVIKKTTKNYLTLQVCEGCYRIVAEECKLIESQRKLAKICNIDPRLQLAQARPKPINLSTTLKQWRMMVYFVGVSHVPRELIKEADENQIIMRYRLGNGDSIEHNWRVKFKYRSNSSSFQNNFNVDLDIKKVKVHYFYSETADIDTFLKQTEINVQLAGVSDQKVFAKGSTGTLSSFGRQFQPDLCLRQTSTILLFYSDGEYCQMTIKVGLICDGVYQLSDSVSLIPLNEVYFADNNFANSNPIPNQWMQAFGVGHNIHIPEVEYSEIMSPQLNDNFLQFYQPDEIKSKNKKCRTALTRKSLNFLK